MDSTNDKTAGRIIGIGGIFFKSAEPASLRAWYEQSLGLTHGPSGLMFKWRSTELPEEEHVTVWSIFPQASNYFDPSQSQFMVNYIVDDLEAFLVKLRARGIEIDPKRENHEYGRFAWIYDPDGNKIELWQP